MSNYLKIAKNSCIGESTFEGRLENPYIEIVIDPEKILEVQDDEILAYTQQKLFRVLTILCKAYARIALKNEITINDVQQIIDIYKISLSIQDLI